MRPTIRPLDPAEVALVAQFYRDAPDYWVLAEGSVDPDRQAAEFFTDVPPGCDPAQSDRLGLFLDGRLSGVCELSYGFPAAGDAYLGLMLLGPWAQGQGLVRDFLQQAETLARAKGARVLYLAVLEANPRGWAFWQREGFDVTGKSGHDPTTGHTLHRLQKPLLHGNLGRVPV